MSIFLKLIIFVVFAVLHGCATYGKIGALPLEEQEFINKDGQNTLISKKSNTVSLAFEPKAVKSGQQADFFLTVNNSGSNDVLFSIEDMLVTSDVGNSGNTVELKIFSQEELIAGENKRQKLRMAWITLGAILHGLDAGLNKKDNPNAGQEVKTQYADEMTKLQAEGMEKLQQLTSIIPQQQIVSAGEWKNNTVRVQLPKITDRQEKIMFVINFDEEDHKFNFTLEKAEKESFINNEKSAY